MKRHLAIGSFAVALALASVPAQATSFLSITVDGTTVSCNNSVACGAGFTTALNSDAIQFTGVVNGVSFGGGGVVGLQLTGNSPGSPALAFVLDTKTSLMNTSGVSHMITVDFGQNNFTQPVGSGSLSAAQTANWTASSATDTQAFQTWLRNTNDLVVPGGTATAISPLCASPGGSTAQACSQEANVAANSTAPFALTGREIINIANGTIASYTGTARLTAQAVPEPVSLLLLGAGLVGIANRRRRQTA